MRGHRHTIFINAGHDECAKKKKISLRHAMMSDGDLYEVIKVLEASEVLEELYLDRNNLTLANGELANALARNRTLRVLSLVGNQIGPEGAKKLAAAIEANGTLRIIHLGHNPIGAEGAKSLGKALKVNKSIETITMWDSEIGDEGAKSLAASFEINETLNEVDLFGNNITEEGAQILADSLKKNFSIDHLLVYDPHDNLRGDLLSEINTILKDDKRKVALMKDKIKGRDEEIRRRDEEIVALKAGNGRNEEIGKRDQEIAALKAGIEASCETINILKKSLRAPLDQMTTILDSVDMKSDHFLNI